MIIPRSCFSKQVPKIQFASSIYFVIAVLLASAGRSAAQLALDPKASDPPTKILKWKQQAIAGVVTVGVVALVLIAYFGLQAPNPNTTNKVAPQTKPINAVSQPGEADAKSTIDASSTSATVGNDAELVAMAAEVDAVLTTNATPSSIPASVEQDASTQNVQVKAAAQPASLPSVRAVAPTFNPREALGTNEQSALW
jgi:hypothetical protein